MLTATPVPDTDVLEIVVDGALSADAVKQVREQLSVFIEAHEHPGLLIAYGEVGEVPPAALLQDLETAGLVPGIERAAVVAHERWLRGLTEVGAHLVPTEVRTFDEGARDAALAWLTSPPAERPTD